LTLAALNAAVEMRKPPPGCTHHSDRGSQYVALTHRQTLLRHGFIGSMGRRGNPYDAIAESFMKTMKVEAVYPMAYETLEDVVEDLPRFIDEMYSKRRFAFSSRLSHAQQFEDQYARQSVKSDA
jgi:putative transposase